MKGKIKPIFSQSCFFNRRKKRKGKSKKIIKKRNKEIIKKRKKTCVIREMKNIFDSCPLSVDHEEPVKVSSRINNPLFCTK